MDIRNFFGAPKITKNSKEVQKDETSSKPVKNDKGRTSKSRSKLEKQNSKDREKKVTPKKQESKSKTTPQTSKTESKKTESSKKTIIQIDSDEDENGNFSTKTKSRDKRQSRDLFIDSDDDKTPKKASKRKKKQISSDDEESEEVIKPSSKKSKSKRKSHRVLDSDDEEDPIPQSDKKSRKKGGKKAGPIYLDESDEERRKKSTLNAYFKTPSPQKSKLKEDVKKQDSNVKRTPVSVLDFFGGGSVKRTERPTVVSKRKLEEDEEEKDKFDDMEMHDDDDFLKTLEDLDEARPPKKARVDSPEKEKPTSKPAGTIASKLAAKAKFLVEETPEKTKSKDVSGLEKKSPKKESPVKRFSPAKPEKISPKKPSSSASEKASTPKPDKAAHPKVSPRKTTSPETPGTLERKGSMYKSYLTREGPQALGSKEIPEGGENCLEGLTFVITGILESLERDDAKQLVEKYGGKVTTSVSKKTSFMVVGRDAGESKLAKARSCGTKQISEDELLDLIRTRPGKKSKYELQAEESFKKEQAESLKKKDSIKTKTSEYLSKFERTPSPKKHMSIEMENSQSESTITVAKSESKVTVAQSESKDKGSAKPEESLLWVDKYKPSAMKQIIGQTGDKSNAKKLLNWLNNWHKNRAAGVKPSGKFFGKDETGAGLRAALLSGPPGIGKTTTATLVCKEAGFSFVELNASDTRSKKNLQSVVAESLSNTTMVDFTGGQGSKTHGHKHCLVMDEVDGMAGNEDRGGIQEMVALIKNTKIPIICMCNDRNHPKMRTLSNHCFDLRFQRPRVEQIKAAMMSLAFKEGLKVPPPALNEIILASNQDIRQVIHNLSMWSASNKTMTYEQTKKDAEMAKKDMHLGPFEVCRKVFAGGAETAGMTLNDKSDLFFHDYSFGPLFVQENYIHVVPYAAKGNVGKHLSQLSRAADSLCDGDLVDKCVRTGQQWGLLPTQAIYASVIPGEHMRGGMSQMIQFPQWLGKNSSTGKHDRILQELQTHMRLNVSCDKRGLNMDYLPFMRTSLTNPLIKNDAEGVPDVIKLMDDYDIIKEDFDNIMEVSKWPNSKDPMSKLAPKTKAAFTRTYNKEVHMTPYATGVVMKKKRGGGAAATEDDMYGEEDRAPSSSDEEGEKIDLDTMIKIKKKENKDAAKKKTAEKKTKAASAKTANSKGKGRGKGKS
ncbi:replication factor C subunit 1-like [Mytilus galloprovincialis]|uniref:replication factor C subunit 1-like n=1 Tax=Mytilus galloprovincialis TaxID=29158 RepID=UPI003F7C25F8